MLPVLGVQLYLQVRELAELVLQQVGQEGLRAEAQAGRLDAPAGTRRGQAGPSGGGDAPWTPRQQLYIPSAWEGREKGRKPSKDPPPWKKEDGDWAAWGEVLATAARFKTDPLIPRWGNLPRPLVFFPLTCAPFWECRAGWGFPGTWRPGDIRVSPGQASLPPTPKFITPPPFLVLSGTPPFPPPRASTLCPPFRVATPGWPPLSSDAWQMPRPCQAATQAPSGRKEMPPYRVERLEAEDDADWWSRAASAAASMSTSLRERGTFSALRSRLSSSRPFRLSDRPSRTSALELEEGGLRIGGLPGTRHPALSPQQTPPFPGRAAGDSERVAPVH